MVSCVVVLERVVRDCLGGLLMCFVCYCVLPLMCLFDRLRCCCCVCCCLFCWLVLLLVGVVVGWCCCWLVLLFLNVLFVFVLWFEVC